MANEKLQIKPISITEVSGSLNLDTPLFNQGFHHAPLTDEQDLTDPPLGVIPGISTRRATFSRTRNAGKSAEASLTIVAADLTGVHEFTASYKLLNTYINVQDFRQSSPKFQMREKQGLIQERDGNNVLYRSNDLTPGVLQQFQWYLEGKCPYTGNNQPFTIKERSTVLPEKIVSSAVAASVMSCETLLHHAARDIRLVLNEKRLPLEMSVIFDIYGNPALRALVRNHLIYGILARRISKEEVRGYGKFQRVPEQLREFERDWDELSIHAVWKDSKKKREIKEHRRVKSNGKARRLV